MDEPEQRISGLDSAPSSWAARGLQLLLGLFLGFLVLEASLQVAVRTDAPAFLSNPEAYAHPLCDEWYWRTRAAQASPTPSLRLHPRLGWTREEGPSTGDGVWVPNPGVDGAAVVMLGDSFIAGTTVRRHRIASLVQEMLVAEGYPARVEDLSVGGFGLGQVLLRLEMRAETLEKGTPVVIGLLTTDIDRAILSVRDAPKPRLEQTAKDGLVVHADHLIKPVQRPAFKLLSWARWRRYWDGVEASAVGLAHPECRVEEKKVLARALLGRMAQTCMKHSLRCLVLPMLRQEDLARPLGWREELLTRHAEAVGLQVVSLRSRLEATQAPLFREDRHPSADQNKLIAEAITAWIADAS